MIANPFRGMRRVVWPLLGAVLWLLPACESSQPPQWWQEERSRPPAPKTTISPPSPSQAQPPVSGPRSAAPTYQNYQGVWRPAPPAPPAGPAPTAGGARPPSLLPYLSGTAKPGAAEPEMAPSLPAPGDSGSRIALLLPLTGANARLGTAMLNAAQLAVFDWADEKFELVVHDTGGTPEGARLAAELAIGDRATLILGPLLASSVRAVAPIARTAGVPVVAFSSDRSVAGDGVYVMGFLPGAEVRRVVGYARSRGIQRFAALAPDNAFGATVVAALREAAAQAGGTVIQAQFYDPNASDFSPVVRHLANYDARRHALVSQRKALEGKEDEVSKRALDRLSRLQTLGELPFDALLVADGGKRLQAIAALLPFYDIDPAKVRMLGTGQWDEPGIGAEPALLGGWFAAPPPQTRVVFEQRFKQAYRQAAPRLATLAYDAAALAAVLAKTNGLSAQTLRASGGFWGADGIFRFRSDGLAERGLAVLQIGRDGPKVIGKAPEAFAPLTN